jgi:hypothetical protein
MNAPVVVINSIKQSTKGIFLDPVNFKIAEWLSVPASNDREAVPAR